jgi:phosphate:Na+ symporter
MVVNFHTLFNVALAVVFIVPVDKLASMLIELLPDPVSPVDPGAPQYLEEAAIETASVALVNAAREALRMAEMYRRCWRACSKSSTAMGPARPK